MVGKLRKQFLFLIIRSEYKLISTGTLDLHVGALPIPLYDHMYVHIEIAQTLSCGFMSLACR